MTDEHIIPRSIGGDARTVIKVCKTCNNTVGQELDSRLSSDGWMRLNGAFAGGIANRHDRLEATTKLKGGRELEGYFYFVRKDNGLLLCFEPKFEQDDGTRWLSEDVKTDVDKLPPEINIFRRDMVEYWGPKCPPARNSGMEPAMLKILLGIIYMDHGQALVATDAFDYIRSSLSGVIHPDVHASWLKNPMQWGDSIIRNHEHAVFYECCNGKSLKAGVALFGTGIVFEIHHFNCTLPKRCVRWDARPGPQNR